MPKSSHYPLVRSQRRLRKRAVVAIFIITSLIAAAVFLSLGDNKHELLCESSGCTVHVYGLAAALLAANCAIFLLFLCLKVLFVKKS